MVDALFQSSLSNLLIVSSVKHDDNAWCVDPRGHLTLSVAKEAYERLGLVGQKLPFKGHDGHHSQCPPATTIVFNADKGHTA